MPDHAVMAKSPKSQRGGGLFSRWAQRGPAWQRENNAKEAITHESLYPYGGITTTVASLLVSGTRVARSREQIYDKWAGMEADPLCSAGLKLLVTAALGGHEATGDVVFIERRPVADEHDELGKLVDEIEDDLTQLLNEVAYPLAYLGAAFGDSYGRIYADNSGVRELYVDEQVRPPLIQPFERASRTMGFAVFTGNVEFERLDLSQMVRLKMPRTQWVPQHGVFQKAQDWDIRSDDLLRLPLMPSMIGGSLLYPAEAAYDNLTASLLGLVGQRWMDSIDEQMVGVDLSDMSKDQQDRFLASIKAMLSRSKQLREDAVKNGKPVLESVRHLIPTFREKQVVKIESPNGGQSGRSGAITVDDIMLHARLLSAALGVDLSMIGFADQLSGGLGEGGFFRMSAQAAESGRMIRGATLDALNHIIDIHTLKKHGVVFPPRERPWRITLYGSISALEKERTQTLNDGMAVGSILATVIQQLKDLGADPKEAQQFLTDTLKLDEEQAKVYAKWVKAKSPDDADGGAPPGGGLPAMGGGKKGGGSPFK